MRDVMAGMKAVIYRRTTSNSVGHLGPKYLVGGAKFRAVLEWAELGGL